MATSTTIVAYLALFATTGFLFVAASLLIGRFLRRQAPTQEKLETYECGEPAIGSSFVQFDLRFYVIALVFIVFDVEVAFFFPWANVFGSATRLMNPNVPRAVASSNGTPAPMPSLALRQTMAELGVPAAAALPSPASSPSDNNRIIGARANLLARAALVDMGVFFGVLLIGFAYVWSMGDLDWVRAIGRGATAAAAIGDAALPELPKERAWPVETGKEQ